MDLTGDLPSGKRHWLILADGGRCQKVLRDHPSEFVAERINYHYDRFPDAAKAYKVEVEGSCPSVEGLGSQSRCQKAFSDLKAGDKLLSDHPLLLGGGGYAGRQ